MYLVISVEIVEKHDDDLRLIIIVEYFRWKTIEIKLVI